MGLGYAPETVKISKSSAQYFGDQKTLLSHIRNNLVQIKTGEGKSVTLAVLSVIFALYGFDVRCACYSAYLSERDFLAFKTLFDTLELTTHIKYSTFNQICEEEINKSIYISPYLIK
jgi:preprotein translocase subunit SecA